MHIGDMLFSCASVLSKILKTTQSQLLLARLYTYFYAYFQKKILLCCCKRLSKGNPALDLTKSFKRLACYNNNNNKQFLIPAREERKFCDSRCPPKLWLSFFLVEHFFRKQNIGRFAMKPTIFKPDCNFKSNNWDSALAIQSVLSSI